MQLQRFKDFSQKLIDFQGFQGDFRNFLSNFQRFLGKNFVIFQGSPKDLARHSKMKISRNVNISQMNDSKGVKKGTYNFNVFKVFSQKLIDFQGFHGHQVSFQGFQGYFRDFLSPFQGFWANILRLSKVPQKILLDI